jgi:hypothetical protein
MNWNSYDTELEHELRQERNTAQDTLFAVRRTNNELHRQLSAQRRYIEELEKQLEPGVVQEIREHLEEAARPNRFTQRCQLIEEHGRLTSEQE